MARPSSPSGGEIDVYTAPKLRDKITELVAAGVYDLVIDMEEVEFLDSTGLGVLVGGLKKVRAHDGSLQLVCNQDRLLKIFRITGLAKVFVIHESADAALAAQLTRADARSAPVVPCDGARARCRPLRVATRRVAGHMSVRPGRSLRRLRARS